MKTPKTKPTLAANALIIAALTFRPGGICLPVRAQPVAKTMAPLPPSAPSVKEINAFGEADKKQMPPAGAVLFIGSSSIRLWDTGTPWRRTFRRSR